VKKAEPVQYIMLEVLNPKRHEMEISFECKKCGRLFDCDVGAVTLPENSDRPPFERKIFCPRCGELTIDEVLLTELGQSQLTEATFDFDDDDPFGSFEGECQGCDFFTRLNDLGLCEECAGKLERDLIRQRDWDYSVTAYGVPASKREELRMQIVAQYGEKLELIAPSEGTQKKKKSRMRESRRKRSGSSR
jgi:hypothetical protein